MPVSDVSGSIQLVCNTKVGIILSTFAFYISSSVVHCVMYIHIPITAGAAHMIVHVRVHVHACVHRVLVCTTGVAGCVGWSEQ